MVKHKIIKNKAKFLQINLKITIKNLKIQQLINYKPYLVNLVQKHVTQATKFNLQIIL